MKMPDDLLLSRPNSVGLVIASQFFPESERTPSCAASQSRCHLRFPNTHKPVIIPVTRPESNVSDFRSACSNCRLDDEPAARLSMNIDLHQAPSVPRLPSLIH